MKKLLLIFSFFLIFLSGKSQTWCPPGATWYYDINFINCDGYYKFEYVGDSLISSVPCKKIIQSSRMKCWWDSDYQNYILDTFYMNSDADHVFFFKNNQFNLLYDFSVQVGDTMYVNGITKPWWGDSCDSVAKLIVDSVGVVNINSEILRYYCIHPLSGSPFSFQGRIVEKIGPFLKYPFMNGVYGSNYFLPVKNDTCGLFIDEEPENGTFRCYTDNNFSTVSVIQYSCDYTLGIKEDEFQTGILFPNPADDFIQLPFFEKFDDVNITIFGADGKLIRQSFIVAESEKLFVGDLPEGLYVLKMDAGGIHRLSRKIVISR